jgi:mRNA-degrading endonuclease RelE of RelBE toxin-antitoxin system
LPYRVEFHAKAAAELTGLPDEASDALVAVLVKISREPQANTREDQLADETALRWAPFGSAGLVYVWVDDDRQVVTVHGITWAG